MSSRAKRGDLAVSPRLPRTLRVLAMTLELQRTASYRWIRVLIYKREQNWIDRVENGSSEVRIFRYPNPDNLLYDTASSAASGLPMLHWQASQ